VGTVPTSFEIGMEINGGTGLAVLASGRRAVFWWNAVARMVPASFEVGMEINGGNYPNPRNALGTGLFAPSGRDIVA
jgi:hypothetical protein